MKLLIKVLWAMTALAFVSVITLAYIAVWVKQPHLRHNLVTTAFISAFVGIAFTLAAGLMNEQWGGE